MKGAKTVRLGDVCEVLDSRRLPITQKDRKPGPIPYYGATGVVDHVADYIFDEPLLLLGEDGAKWGACENSAFLINGKAWVNNHAHVLRTKPQLDRKFAMYYLNMTDLSEYITGVTVPKLNQARMCAITLPLPPLATQRAIVARLDSALARAEALEERFAAIAKNAELSFKAALNEEFAGRTSGTSETSGTGDSSCSRSSSTPRDPSDPSKPWPLVRLGDVCEIDGKLVQDYAKYANYPHIGIDCIEKGTGALKGYRTVAEDKVKSGKYHFTPHHIIYSKIRPNLNKVATPEFEGLCSADSYAILPKSNCKRRWLAYLLRSENFLGYVVPISNTRAGMPKVNREELLAFEFPLPPLPVQRAIVSRLDAARKRADGIASLARQAAEAAANLRKALLKEAFE